MASNIASLRVLLGLDAAEYTRGLNKAEKQAQTFSSNLTKTLGAIGAGFSLVAISSQILETTKAIISEAAALNDLSDATGSSVEALSRLNNQSKIAGTDFATMQAAVLKLSQSLAGTDDESSKATEALRLLGITTKDPAQALQEIAVKLNTYEDGVNKVALAVALFGKQGAQFLATLKDIANLQDVAATRTKAQAEEAEKLEQAMRRLTVESTKFAEAVLNEVVPQLNAMIERFLIARRSGAGFFASIIKGIDEQGDAVPRLAAITAEIDQLQKTIDKQRTSKSPFVNVFGDSIKANEEQLAGLKKQQEFLAGIVDLQEKNRSSGGATAPKPPAPAISGGGSDGKARAIREQQSATDSYIKSLEKQLQSSLDLNIVETAEVQIYDLMQNAMSGMTAERAAYIRDIAQQLQFTKDAEEASKRLAKAQKEEADEIQRRVDASRRANEQAQHEIDSIKGSVEAVNLQIRALTKGEKAVDEYNAAKREQLAVEKEIAAQRATEAGDFALAAKYREAAQALRELNAVSGKLRLAEDLKKEAQALQDVKNAISDTFANAFADVITGSKSAKDAFKSLCDDIVRQVSKVAAQNLANALFGGQQQGGPDFFGTLVKFLPMLFGGGSAGFTTPGDFGGGVPQFATGGVSSGGFAMVGERGPELVNLPSGSRVYNNADSKGMLGKSVTINQTVNVMAGANTQSARQAAARLRDVTLDAVRDR